MKDPKVLMMRAALNMSKKGVNNMLAQIDTQVGRISSMREDQVLEAIIKENMKQLDSLFDQGEVALKKYHHKSAALISTANFLAMEATSLRDRVVGEHEP